MSIVKRKKKKTPFKKTESIGGERARFYHLGVQDRQRGAKHRYYYSPANSSSRWINLCRAYSAGYYSQIL